MKGLETFVHQFINSTSNALLSSKGIAAVGGPVPVGQIAHPTTLWLSCLLSFTCHHNNNLQPSPYSPQLPPTSILANFKSDPKSFPIFSPTYQQHLYHQQLYQKQPHIIVALKAPPASRFHTSLWLRTLIPSMDPPSR